MSVKLSNNGILSVDVKLKTCHMETFLTYKKVFFLNIYMSFV